MSGRHARATRLLDAIDRVVAEATATLMDVRADRAAATSSRLLPPTTGPGPRLVAADPLEDRIQLLHVPRWVAAAATPAPEPAPTWSLGRLFDEINPWRRP